MASSVNRIRSLRDVNQEVTSRSVFGKTGGKFAFDEFVFYTKTSENSKIARIPKYAKQT